MRGCMGVWGVCLCGCVSVCVHARACACVLLTDGMVQVAADSGVHVRCPGAGWAGAGLQRYSGD